MPSVQRSVTIRNKADWRDYFLLIWTSGVLIGIVVLSVGLIDHPNRLDDVLFVMIIMLALGFFALTKLRWRFKGSTHITLENEEMKIERKQSTFKSNRCLDLNKLHSFQVMKRRQMPLDILLLKTLAYLQFTFDDEIVKIDANKGEQECKQDVERLLDIYPVLKVYYVDTPD